MISTPVLLAVLGSALLHAGWNFLVKASGERLLDTATLALGGSLLAAFLLPWVSLPASASLPWLAISVLIHVAYFVALIETYRHADLSVAYPLMRGLAPVFVLLALSMSDGSPTLSFVGGVALLCTGVTLPALLGLQRGIVIGKGIYWALLNALIIASYTVVDGVGVRLSGNPWSYTLWLFFLDAWGILAIAAWRRPGHLVTHLRRRWRFGVVGAVATVGSYGVVLWAMSVAPVAAVAAIRETSVIFAALLGTRYLGEKMGGVRVASALLVAAGAVTIRFSG
ncbi:EamA family transporter [Zoogloea ramigera]|uniref:EamA family transporter n=1 Tax=Zoogloea ramigera TaxID=350 RepID=UPI003FA261E4